MVFLLHKEIHNVIILIIYVYSYLAFPLVKPAHKDVCSNIINIKRIQFKAQFKS